MNRSFAIRVSLILFASILLSPLFGVRQNASTLLDLEPSYESSLPSPWSSADIGSVASSGSVEVSNETYSITSSGKNIWGKADSLHYVYQTLSGDGEIQARVASLQNPSSGALAGVMIRESLVAGSKHASSLFSSASGVTFRYRASTKAKTKATTTNAQSSYWVRLVREGNTITSLRSDDGENWTAIKIQTLSMGSEIMVGLAVSGNNNQSPSTGVFEAIKIIKYGDISSVSFNPQSVTGGSTCQGTVSLSGPAPYNGATVSLNSSNSTLAPVPSKVLIPSGARSANFNVSTGAVAANTSVSVTGSYKGIFKTGSINLSPPTTTAPTLTSVLLDPSSVTGGSASQGMVVLSGAAPSGGSTVSLSSSNTSAATVPASVTVAAGSSSASFTVNTSAVSSTTSANITASMSGVSQSATLTVQAPPPPTVTISLLTLSPTSLVGGSSSQGTVYISSAAPSGGSSVSLSSSNTSVANVPASVTVAAGATSATFTVTTKSVTTSTSVNITGSLGGVSRSASLNVTSASAPTLSSISVNPASVMGGSASQGSVTLSAAAPSGGAVVPLSSSNPSVTTLPASVTVNAGATTATFSVGTQAVSATTAVNISGSSGGVTRSASLTVQAPAPTLTSVSLNPTSVLGGSASQGTVTLSAAAPSGGATVTLASSNTSVASVPASVTVGAGATSATFSVTTQSVSSSTSVNISGSYGGASRSASLTVTAPAPTVSSLTLNPTSVTGPATSQATVTLSGAAPSGGSTVSLSSSNTSAATVPASVTVAAGSSSASFTVNTSAVSSTTSANITASMSGVSRSATLTVQAPPPPSPTLSTLSLNATSVVGGGTVQATVTISSAAPSGGSVVSLASSNTSVANVPASVTVAAGATSASFTVTTQSVTTSTSVNITGSLGGVSRSGSLTVNPPPLPTLTAVTLNPTSVAGGSTSQGSVTLSGPAPSGGAVVTLSSTDTSAATTPASVTVAAGSTGANFTASTQAVSTTKTVTISGSYNGATMGAGLTVQAPPPPPPPSGGFYVAPNGSASGNGSITNPWDLQTALKQPASVTAGATIYLRGGLYKGKFTSNLTGVAGNPITVRSYPGEWAIIEGFMYTTLAAAMTSTQTTITLTDAKGFFNGGVVIVGNEHIRLTTQSGNTFNCIRGWDGSTPAAHNPGDQTLLGGNTLEVLGSDTIYRDFEVMNSDPLRVVNYLSPQSAPNLRGEGVNVHAPRTKLINLVLHDNQEGVGFWKGAVDSEVYGCIIYNNGYQDPNRGHGHGLYIHNETGIKRIIDVISFNNFATGMKAYGQTGPVVGVHFEGIASFNNGSPAAHSRNPSGYSANYRISNLYVGADLQVPRDITIVDNYLYHSPGTQVGLSNLGLGYTTSGGTNLRVENNYVAGGHQATDVKGWASAVVRGNVFYAEVLASVKTATSWSYDWNSNEYYDGSSAGQTVYPFTFNQTANRLGGGRLQYDDVGTSLGKGWKQWTGFDANSRYSAGRPTGVRVFVRPNQYEAGRAHIIVYNWSLQKSVTVDVRGVLRPGDNFEIRNAQNYFQPPVFSGVFDGEPIRISMEGSDVARPVGLDFDLPSTSPEFNVFILIKR